MPAVASNGNKRLVGWTVSSWSTTGYDIDGRFT